MPEPDPKDKHYETLKIHLRGFTRLTSAEKVARDLGGEVPFGHGTLKLYQSDLNFLASLQARRLRGSA